MGDGQIAPVVNKCFEKILETFDSSVSGQFLAINFITLQEVRNLSVLFRVLKSIVAIKTKLRRNWLSSGFGWG